MKEREGTEEITTLPSTLTCCKDSRPCPSVSQYQLDTPVTKATGHLRLIQPPLSDILNIFFTLPRKQGMILKYLPVSICLSIYLSIYSHEKKRPITKTCLYNIDPLEPHFYIVKLGFTGVYITFLISAQKHRLWVLVRTASLRQF